MNKFVNLHTTTVFSVGYSLIKPEDLIDRVKYLGQSAVAVTDNAMGGLFDSYQAAKKTGIKLITGCQFNFVEDLAQENQKFRSIVLLAKNHNGYKNLLKLGKLSYDNSVISFKKVFPRIDWKLLEENSEDLICLTSGSGGILGQLISTRKTEEAKQTTIRLHEIFEDNLGLEIQANNMKRQANNYTDWLDQDLTNRQVIKFGKELNIKIVPTNPAAYLLPEHYEAMDVFMAMYTGQPIHSNARPRFVQNEFYIKSEEEVRKFFTRLYPNDIDSWIENTKFFADQCDDDPAWILPSFSNDTGTELPEFPVYDQPDYQEFLIWKEKYCNSEELPKCFRFDNSHKIDGIYLRFTCWKQFGIKLPYVKEEQKQVYYNQIEEEISVFEYKDICGYMLIVYDYTDFCRRTGIPVGLGRGSVGGSCVAFLLGIHQADPIKYELIFERFYNREKKDFSDIDQDFSQAGKGQVEEYIANKYGKDNCCQISNYLTLTSKPYVKAIARVFQYGGDRKAAVKIGNDIAERIPADEKNVVRAVDTPLIKEWCKKYPELKTYAALLTGKPVALAKHAGGVIICKRPLHEIVPTRRDKDGKLVIEYEKDRTEKNGLMKFDILGVTTLDQVDSTIKLIKSRGKQIPDLSSYDDKKTYELIQKGNTFGVFQLGTSSGTIRLCQKVKPIDVLDLAVINALTRPGFPAEERDNFVEAKNSGKKAEFLHPSLERALGPTFGYPLFEECLMYIAQDVAGWSKLDSDKLRKFVKDKGKNPEKGPILKKEFINGAVNKGIDKTLATQIWDKNIASQNSYSFNKSHALFYSFLGYQTAFLKTHFPIEFLVTFLAFEAASLSPKAKDNIIQIKNELREMGVKILPPNINESGMTYTIIDDKTLLMGLDSLKFIGKDSIPEIMAKRPFKSFADFLTKVDGRKVRAPSVCALAASGCLDIYGMPRKQMFLYAADFKKKLQLWNKKERDVEFQYPFPDVGEWTSAEKFAMESYYLGEGLSNNVFEIYPGFFNNKACDFTTLASHFPIDLPHRKTKGSPPEFFINSNYGILEGIIKSVFEFPVKKEKSKWLGRIMARLSVMDPYGNTIGLTIFPDQLEELKKHFNQYYGNNVKLEPGVAIHFAGYANWYDGNLSILYDDIKNVSPIPPMPKDIKGKSVSMKITGGKKKKSKEIPDPDILLDEIEEELDEEGLSEPEENEYIDEYES